MISLEECNNAKSYAWNLVLSKGIPVNEFEFDKIEVADLGLGELNKTGLQILTFVNDEWIGVKLLIFQPNQYFPQHKHPPAIDGSYPGKTEALRVHYGQLKLNLFGDEINNPPPKTNEPRDTFSMDNKEIILTPGDQYIIPPNTWHSFQAGNTGAIVWSISSKTTDSTDIFSNPEIIRKTVIKE